MAVYVNTNVSSLNGRRHLNNVQNQLSTTYQRLSSGMRINSAKDDAAGLQIADRLTTQINGLNQGNRNTNDGIALAQTIESGMDEMSGMLQKIRTLAVQSANGTNTKDDRVALSKEANSLMEEITRIAQQTKFGGKKVLQGVQKDGLYATKNGQNALKAGSPATMVLQVGANKGDEINFKVNNFEFSAIASRALGQGGTTDGWEAGAGKGMKLDSASGAKAAIELMDKMIADVDSQRSDLGAIQNRLDSSIRYQSNLAANQADARSRIRDADFAEESAL